MTVDSAVLAVRLATMTELLNDLSGIGEVSAQRLHDDRIVRHAVERILGQLVDLAVSVNSHVVAATTSTAPATYRESFAAAAQQGLISGELAERLAPSAGLRNVLAHEYVAIDLALVAAAVPRTLVDYTEYVRAVSGWLLAREA